MSRFTFNPVRIFCLSLLPAVLFGGPEDIIINEIHYHPEDVCESDEFVELFNRGDTVVDLSGWKMTEGFLFTFPEGVIMRGGEYLLLAPDPDAVAAKYNVSTDRIFAVSGRLSNNGEDVVLVDASDNEIDRVRYNDRFPWPISPDGGGPSLECRNPFADNSSAGNWGPAGAAGPVWRLYSARGTAGDDLLQIALNGTGEFLIDDVSLRENGTGPELIRNGGFESAGLSYWSVQGNHSASFRDTARAHSGTACLHVKSAGSGGDGNAITQTINGLVLEGPEYELSFWALRITPGVKLRAGIAGGEAVLTENRDIGAVGAAGSATKENGVYTVKASGADIWGTADEFHYVYASVSGDIEIEARVTWNAAPNSWSKAGLMVRETTGANSKFVMNILSRDNGVNFQRRPSTGSGCENTGGPSVSDTVLLRLGREGDTFTASYSTGGAFQEYASASISMADDVLVGLCVTSHQDGQLAEAVFEDVVLNGSGGGLGVSTPANEPGETVAATPLAVNTQYTTDLPPYVHAIHAYAPTGDPENPYWERISSSDDVHLVARVEDVDPVTSVILEYQVVLPGRYIRIEDPEYLENWQTVVMRDDGTGGDDEAGDGIYTALIPHQPHRTLVRYRITATAGGKTTRVPYPDDTVPNFAYFVYDGVPDYVCDVRSAFGPAPYVHRAQDLTKVPVYHLICDEEDLTECEYRAISFGDKVQRKLLKWQGTFVFDPMGGGERKVFDNVRFRLRGGVWRYTWQKRMYKISFPRGHHFKGQYNNGKRYPEPRRKLNIQSIIDQNWTGVRGISGIHEAMAFWLFRQAGVAAAHTTWIHFRTVVRNSEEGQYDGDFKGLFLDIEQPDAGLLNTNDRPRGNLYKIDTGAIGWDIDTITGEYIEKTGRPDRWDKEETVCSQSELDDDLAEFYDTYRSGAQSILWWRRNLDLDRYYSYRVVLDSIKHYDIQAGKNYYYYHNSRTDLWEVLPWDTDLILKATCCGDTTYGENEPFWKPVIERYPDVFGVEYRNRFREYLQLVANREHLDPLIDMWVERIKKLHEADRDRWDYFPLPDPYPYQGKTERDPYQGLYASIDRRVREMRQELDRRLAFVWSNTSNFCGFDADKIPDQPSIVSPSTSPIELDPEDLVFSSSSYHDPNGDPIAASFWQATRVLPDDDDLNWTNELNPDIAEEKNSNFFSWLIPPDEIILGEEYLVRVRYEDSTGRRSLWSDPVRVTVVDSASAKPVAVLTASRYVGGAPLEVTFDASESHDPDGDALTYFWDFGDGAKGEGEIVDHLYTRLGNFTVTLVVDDGRGRRDSESTVISVIECSSTESLALEGIAGGGGESGKITLEVEAGEELVFEIRTVLRQEGSPPPDGIRGWSFGVAHDPDVLEVAAARAAGELQSVLGADPYVSTRKRSNGVTQAVILSTTDLTELPSDLTELRTAGVTYRLTASHDVAGETITTLIHFSDAVGDPPVEVLVNRGVEGFRPCSVQALTVEINVVGESVPRFLRGDANMDGQRDISDPVHVLRYLFGSVPGLRCMDAADANDDGVLNVADAIALLAHLFGNAGPLPEPMNAPGTDPTPDPLDCETGL